MLLPLKLPLHTSLVHQFVETLPTPLNSTMHSASIASIGWNTRLGVGDGHRLHDVLQFFETSLKHRIVKK